MCSPATPTFTKLIDIPARLPAIDIAAEIASAVFPIFATSPLCKPSEGATPNPSTLYFSDPSFFSAITAQTFVVPKSNPAIISFFIRLCFLFDYYQDKFYLHSEDLYTEYSSANYY